MLRLFLYSVCLGLCVSCGPAHVSQEPAPTQLEIREFQTRTFEGKNYNMVLKSLLDVLQDDGYMVKNVSADLGFLSAVKDVGLKQSSGGPDLGIGVGFSSGGGVGVGFGIGGHTSSRSFHQVIEATINITSFGDDVRVRASFLSKVYDNRESVVSVQQITDEEFYQNFFAKVDKGIYIQGQAI